jgi:hypothetical protein
MHNPKTVLLAASLTLILSLTASCSDDKEETIDKTMGVCYDVDKTCHYSTLKEDATFFKGNNCGSGNDIWLPECPKGWKSNCCTASRNTYYYDYNYSSCLDWTGQPYTYDHCDLH